MARGKIPDPLARRHLLERPLDAAKARAIAQAYLDEERAGEALAFLVKADDREGLEALRSRAVEEGDLFLVREATRGLGGEMDAATWHAVAEAAEARGKAQYAAEARRQAGALES